ncbi:unnamed protein product [Adineta ricciae]|uniref:Uncharacterized protein n=1 Tax=Adineta ricciae TaxID=249248 RepID=A0A815DLQ7_ADIRI|nr:unnamed protein product [Adineta ricciae]
MSSYLFALIAFLAVTSSINAHVAELKLTATATLQSHDCKSKNANTVEGKIVLKNTDHNLLGDHKDTLSKALTDHVRSGCAANAKSEANVHTVTKLGNGDLEVAYTCTGVKDHDTCHKSLHAACGSDHVKQTIGKCSHSHPQTGKAAPAKLELPTATIGKSKSPQSYFLLAVAGSATLHSHDCKSKDATSVEGKIVLKNTDHNLLGDHKDTLSKALTDHVRSGCAANAKSEANVHTVTKLGNGDLEVAYTCTGVKDHDTCHKSLHAACGSDHVKQTIGKCSHSHPQTGKAAPAKLELPTATIGKSKSPQVPTVAGSAALHSHDCKSKDATSVEGKIVLKNTDHNLLGDHKDTLSKALTDHVRSGCAANAKSEANVHTVTKLGNGDLEVAYTCTGVKDHDTCHKSLHAACGSDHVKQTIGKCSHSHPQTGKAAPHDAHTAATVKKETHAAVTASPALHSHDCKSKDSHTVEGKIVLKNTDHNLLGDHKDALSKALTDHVRSGCAANAKSEANVHTVTKLGNGDLEVAYTCKGVKDHDTCHKSLHAACGSDHVKQTIGKCSHSHAHTGKPAQHDTHTAVPLTHATKGHSEHAPAGTHAAAGTDAPPEHQATHKAEHEASHKPEHHEATHKPEHHEASHKPEHHEASHNPEHHDASHKPEHHEASHKPEHHEATHKPEHHEATHKPEHHEATHKPEHHEASHKPEHHEATHKPEHHEATHKPEHHEASHKPEHHEASHKPEHHEATHKPEHHEASHKPEHHGKDHEATHKPEHHGASHKPEHHGVSHKPEHHGVSHKPEHHGASHEPQHHGKDHGATHKPEHHGKDHEATHKPEHHGKEHGASHKPEHHGKDHESTHKPEHHGASHKPEHHGASHKPEHHDASHKPEHHGASHKPEHHDASHKPEHHGASHKPEHGASHKPEHHDASHKPEHHGASHKPEHGASHKPEHHGKDHEGTHKPEHHGASHKPEHHGKDHEGTHKPEHHGASHKPEHHGASHKPEHGASHKPEHHGASHKPEHHGKDHGATHKPEHHGASHKPEHHGKDHGATHKPVHGATHKPVHGASHKPEHHGKDHGATHKPVHHGKAGDKDHTPSHARLPLHDQCGFPGRSHGHDDSSSSEENRVRHGHPRHSHRDDSSSSDENDIKKPQGGCGRCAMSHIVSSVVLNGLTVEKVSRKSGGNFVEQFKNALHKEIQRHHQKGVKSIKVTALNTFNDDKLMVDFVTFVDPTRYHQISRAIRQALTSKAVEKALKDHCN